METTNPLNTIATLAYRKTFQTTYWKPIEEGDDLDALDKLKRDALGVLISQWCEWGGFEICEIFYSALEDSNFHTLNEKIEELVKAEKERWDEQYKR